MENKQTNKKIGKSFIPLFSVSLHQPLSSAASVAAVIRSPENEDKVFVDYCRKFPQNRIFFKETFSKIT